MALPMSHSTQTVGGRGNSASLRFIPKSEMEAQGYGDYIDQVEDI